MTKKGKQIELKGVMEVLQDNLLQKGTKKPAIIRNKNPEMIAGLQKKSLLYISL